MEWNLELGSSLGYICATSGTLASCQVSCPNMTILKIASYLGNRCPLSKYSSISTPWGRKRLYVQLSEVCHLPCFMPKYGNLKKLACISETTARRVKISSISTILGRKRICVQFCQSPSFMPKYGNFENGPVSQKPTATHRAKIKLNLYHVE